jgi:hypothetical protein
MRNRYTLSSASGFKPTRNRALRSIAIHFALLVLVQVLSLSVSGAAEGDADANMDLDGHTRTVELNIERPSWDNFKAYMREREQTDQINGMSYLISGGLATVGSLIGYETSEDKIARSTFAISQSFGILAIGYGASLLSSGNEHSTFYTVLRESRLSKPEKDRLLRIYLRERQLQERQTRMIKALTHGAVALVNGFNAAREDEETLKGALALISGINAVLSLSYAF